MRGAKVLAALLLVLAAAAHGVERAAAAVEDSRCQPRGGAPAKLRTWLHAGERSTAEVPVTEIKGWADLPIADRPAPPYVPPEQWRYNTSSSPIRGKINVHICPHTHDDTGWQITVDQYYYERVQFILDTVVEKLAADPNRRFMYVETAFFATWFEQQTPEVQLRAKKLVENGQLEFVNGGWCMHDEASPLFGEMIDQTTRGHQYLLRSLGTAARPRGTWQIDPFGHSQTQAWLLSAEAGMSSLFWGRTDYQDAARRYAESRLEWIWEGSRSRGSRARTFAGELYGTNVGGGYSSWVSFDSNDARTYNFVQDNPERHDYNVDKWVEKIVRAARQQASQTKTEHQLWAVGGDFAYMNADSWYKNLDKLVHYGNLNGSVNFLYSTPTRYVEEKFKADLSWELRKDDIFPLADAAHHYWTGYFTSRPALKRQLRTASALLQAARQLEAVAHALKWNKVGENVRANRPRTRPSPRVGDGWTDGLEGAVAVATHHDGLSGTSRQSVTNDFQQRIADGAVEAEAGVREVFRTMLLGEQHAQAVDEKGAVELRLGHCNCNGGAHASCLNMSSCEFTVQSSTRAQSFSVFAWNPLAHERGEFVRIPVVSSSAVARWTVTDRGTGVPVDVQLVPLDKRTRALPVLALNAFGLSRSERDSSEKKLQNRATHVLTFNASMPPVGFTTFSIDPVLALPTSKGIVLDGGLATGFDGGDIAHQSPMRTLSAVEGGSAGDASRISNGVYDLTFDPHSGLLSGVRNLHSGVHARLELEWGWYKSSMGGCTPHVDPSVEPCDTQRSGAYIFRPVSDRLYGPGPAATKVKTEVMRGSLVIEVRQRLSSWISHVIRLTKGSPFVELEWTVGPVPLDNPWLSEEDAGGEGVAGGSSGSVQWGKEVVLRYKSDIQNDGVFFADSNAREMVRRERNKRPSSYPPLVVNEPVAGNYYPVNTMIAINDGSRELAVITDVTQGGSSMHDGELELMVHRRVLADDFRGVDEPLNETMCGCNDIHAAPGEMGVHNKHLGDGGCVCQGLTVRGRHWLVLDEVSGAHARRRELEELLTFPPLLTFASVADGQASALGVQRLSLLRHALPGNVRLTTWTSNYAEFHDGRHLLRFAHAYEVGEHETLSEPARFSLKDVFSSTYLELEQAEETSLTADRSVQDVEDSKYPWRVDDGERSSSPGGPQEPDWTIDDDVVLGPMQVRTFWVRFRGAA